MGQLTIYLPPFSSDYAGVCSALFDINSLVIINDANCCTRNYVSFDEPRWTRKQKSTLCSELRTIDAILGNDQKVIQQVVDVSAKLHPEMIAVLGSPVPAIIGMDMQGIAGEIEGICNIPSIGFDTTGFSYYDKGVSAVFVSLLKRFVKKAQTKTENGINILGMTPIDFSANDNAKQFRVFLENRGFTVLSTFLMETSLEQVKLASAATVNLVVSASGMAAAKYMEKYFQIPFVVATPMGLIYTEKIIQALKISMETGKSQYVSVPSIHPTSEETLLIIGEQIIANSIRNALRNNGDKRQIIVGSFFSMVPAAMEAQDIQIKTEKQCIQLLKSKDYQSVIADPLIARIPAMHDVCFLPLVHPAISSHLHWDELPLFIGDEMEKQLQTWTLR